MLKQLSITNYAIIENLEIEFNDGFTVITGETGAGKSILLGALSLILGQRADTSVLNNKEKKCIVEGEFEFSKERFIHFFTKNELDYEEFNIIRREINSKGKSRAFINDTPVSLFILKELTSQLIDIHSQHQTLNIQDNSFQLSVIDVFSDNKENVLLYSERYLDYTQSKKELYRIEELAQKAKADVDYLSFQAREIEELQLKPHEKEEIEAELGLINNSEEIKMVLDNSSEALINSEQNLVSELKSIANLYSKINNCSSSYDSIYKRLNSVIIELEDVVNEIEIENNSLNFNPENLAFLNNRLSSIFSIEQKHNVSSTKEILELLDEFNSQLTKTNSLEGQITELTKKVEQKRKTLFIDAQKISKVRTNNFKALCDNITSVLRELGMPDSKFEVKHVLLDELNEKGTDKIEFLFSPNKGVEPVQLKKAASGGELSRLMLSIKSILSKDKLSSIVFDEIDAGVSGDIADKMAAIMKQISTNMQVISITHLPQVAAKGEHHYKIYKENINDKTLTHLTVLNKKGRVEELAKMLSGRKLSTAALDNAKILLET